MKRLAQIAAEVDDEISVAAHWYDRQRAGLGLEYLESIRVTFERIENTPGVGTPLSGIGDLDLRRVPVRRFPYHVVYVELVDQIRILAVAHDRRRPRYWARRIVD